MPPGHRIGVLYHRVRPSAGARSASGEGNAKLRHSSAVLPLRPNEGRPRGGHPAASRSPEGRGPTRAAPPGLRGLYLRLSAQLAACRGSR